MYYSNPHDWHLKIRDWNLKTELCPELFRSLEPQQLAQRDMKMIFGEHFSLKKTITYVKLKLINVKFVLGKWKMLTLVFAHPKFGFLSSTKLHLWNLGRIKIPLKLALYGTSHPKSNTQAVNVIIIISSTFSPLTTTKSN